MKKINNRVTQLFASKRKNLLSVYYTAGYPGLGDTISMAKYLEMAGADIIEIGIPFSDPVADGPTIQASNKIALENGMNLHLLVDQVREIRKTANIPVILMGYLNPVMQYGMEKFCKEASKAGVDGIILPDMPMEEYLQEYQHLFESSNLTNTFMVSPTTSDERIKKIDTNSQGFIYAVSASSTTGAKGDFSPDQLAYFAKLKGLKLSNPFMIGFGISNAVTFATACSYSAGAIVGSAFINLVKASQQIESDVQHFVKSLKGDGAA
jgi:tryptophan synthase alpha chain